MGRGEVRPRSLADAGRCGLELGREREHEVVAAGRADELDADGHAVGGLVERARVIAGCPVTFQMRTSALKRTASSVTPAARAQAAEPARAGGSASASTQDAVLAARRARMRRANAHSRSAASR